MTIARAYPAGWGAGEKLTSAQQNQVDLNTTYPLDKRAGQTDTLESLISAANAGRIVPTVKVGADADTVYTVADGISVIRIPTTLTANRTYVLSNTGAVDGDTVHVFMETPNARRVKINDAGGNTIHTLGSPTVASSFPGVEGYEASFVWKSTGWQRSKGRPHTLAIETFTATGTWTCPRGVNMVLALVWGGAGGGGGGAGSSTATNAYFVGGGGGGAGLPSIVPCVTTPGSGYDVTIGTGGTGGAGGTPGGGGGVVGASGSSTTFALAGTNLAVGRGGQGGGAPVTVSASGITPTTVWAIGGTAGPSYDLSWGVAGEIVYNESTVNPTSFSLPQRDGQGGFGSSKRSPTPGGLIPGWPFVGGGGGTLGTNTGSLREGGAGGGGGAGPGGNGGAGGNGGNGISGGPGTAGAAGGAGAANTGAGGGGGGAGGCGSVSGASGGAGGAGGSGKLSLIYVIQGA